MWRGPNRPPPFFASTTEESSAVVNCWLSTVKDFLPVGFSRHLRSRPTLFCLPILLFSPCSIGTREKGSPPPGNTPRSASAQAPPQEQAELAGSAPGASAYAVFSCHPPNVRTNVRSNVRSSLRHHHIIHRHSAPGRAERSGELHGDRGQHHCIHQQYKRRLVGAYPRLEAI